ncbi:MAG: hypothetical protein HYZ53_29465 [Planctomycetes bacterium]|nr:hypothetical protein [Planctomycetota bacterium]
MIEVWRSMQATEVRLGFVCVAWKEGAWELLPAEGDDSVSPARLDALVQARQESIEDAWTLCESTLRVAEQALNSSEPSDTVEAAATNERAAGMLLEASWHRNRCMPFGKDLRGLGPRMNLLAEALRKRAAGSSSASSAAATDVYGYELRLRDLWLPRLEQSIRRGGDDSDLLRVWLREATEVFVDAANQHRSEFAGFCPEACSFWRWVDSPHGVPAEEGFLLLAADRGLDPQVSQSFGAPLGLREGLVGRVAYTGFPFLVPCDLVNHPFYSAPALAEKGRFQAALACPVWTTEELRGALLFYSRAPAADETSSDRGLAFARAFARVIESSWRWCEEVSLARAVEAADRKVRETADEPSLRSRAANFMRWLRERFGATGAGFYGFAPSSLNLVALAIAEAPGCEGLYKEGAEYDLDQGATGRVAKAARCVCVADLQAPEALEVWKPEFLALTPAAKERMRGHWFNFMATAVRAYSSLGDGDVSGLFGVCKVCRFVPANRPWAFEAYEKRAFVEVAERFGRALREMSRVQTAVASLATGNSAGFREEPQPADDENRVDVEACSRRVSLVAGAARETARLALTLDAAKPIRSLWFWEEGGGVPFLWTAERSIVWFDADREKDALERLVPAHGVCVAAPARQPEPEAPVTSYAAVSSDIGSGHPRVGLLAKVRQHTEEQRVRLEALLGDLRARLQDVFEWRRTYQRTLRLRVYGDLARRRDVGPDLARQWLNVLAELEGRRVFRDPDREDLTGPFGLWLAQSFDEVQQTYSIRRIKFDIDELGGKVNAGGSNRQLLVRPAIVSEGGPVWLPLNVIPRIVGAFSRLAGFAPLTIGLDRGNPATDSPRLVLSNGLSEKSIWRAACEGMIQIVNLGQHSSAGMAGLTPPVLRASQGGEGQQSLVVEFSPRKAGAP